MADIKPLRDANQEPDKDTVDVLRHALKLAESGELRSVALAGSLTGHRSFTDFATSDLGEAIQLTCFLNFTLCAKQHGTRE